MDKGYSSVKNRKALEPVLDTVIMPKRGKLSKADKERESDPKFVEGRRQSGGGVGDQQLESSGPGFDTDPWPGRLCSDGGAGSGSGECAPYRADSEAERGATKAVRAGPQARGVGTRASVFSTESR